MKLIPNSREGEKWDTKKKGGCAVVKNRKSTGTPSQQKVEDPGEVIKVKIGRVLCEI